MAIPTEKHDDEATMPLQLARIAGDVKLILYQVGDVVKRVDRHEDAVASLKSRTQRLEDGAKASTEKAEALALALKEAKDAVEATAAQEANKAQMAAREKNDRDALGWSPITKLFAVLAGILIVVNIYQALNPGV